MKSWKVTSELRGSVVAQRMHHNVKVNSTLLVHSSNVAAKVASHPLLVAGIQQQTLIKPSVNPAKARRTRGEGETVSERGKYRRVELQINC